MKKVGIFFFYKHFTILLTDTVKMFFFGKANDRKMFKAEYKEKFKKLFSIFKERSVVKNNHKSTMRVNTLVNNEKLEWIRNLKNVSIQELEIPVNKDAWFSKDIILSDNITMISKNVSSYISYLCKSTNFSYFDKNDAIKIEPTLDYEFNYSLLTEGNIRVSLVLVSYVNNTKSNVYVVPPNKRYKVHFKAHEEYIRLALKVDGMGSFAMDKVNIFPCVKFSDNTRGNYINYCGTSEGKNLKAYSDLNIAVITDKFTTECLSYEFNIVEFTPENWEHVLESTKVEALFIESAWKGFQGSWEFRIGKYVNQDKSPLINLIEWCKSRGIPTIFWNKEDPIHFEKFIDTAKLVDYVFTTDENIIEKYKDRCGHEEIYSLMFSAQPKIHNPIKVLEEREDKFCFAGSYYGNRHKDRREDMDRLLDEAMKYGLDIYDRNYNMTKNNPESPFAYPMRFKEAIRGSLPYEKIDIAYKGYKYMLNVNSVKQSPTMFSRRVFEGLACGTPIVSTDALGIERLFSGIVIQQHETNDIHKLVQDKEFYQERALKGLREVLTKHTYANRFYNVFEKASVKMMPMEDASVYMVAYAKDLESFKKLEEIYSRQTYRNKNIIVLVDTFEGYTDLMNQYNTGEFSVYVYSYVKQHYTFLSDFVKPDYVAFVSSENYYGQNYLMDLLLGHKYTDAEIIGKGTYYSTKQLELHNSLEEYQYVYDIKPDRAILSQEVIKSISFEDLDSILENNSFGNVYSKKGFRNFSIDRYNFVEKASIDTFINQVEK